MATILDNVLKKTVINSELVDSCGKDEIDFDVQPHALHRCFPSTSEELLKERYTCLDGQDLEPCIETYLIWQATSVLMKREHSGAVKEQHPLSRQSEYFNSQRAKKTNVEHFHDVTKQLVKINLQFYEQSR